MWSCPRVGLSLKRHDRFKEKQFWMADYRYLTFPGFNGKMKDFTILAMIKQGVSFSIITSLTGARPNKVDELAAKYREGKLLAFFGTKSIYDCHKPDMRSNDWALVYGMH